LYRFKREAEDASVTYEERKKRKDRSARELSGKKERVRETRQTNNSSRLVPKQNVPNVPFKQ
jgi:hypothetical protein|tara:strand:- start:7 stop:192 length:186 start_codon:yes stop_codon:yes gene_type:complete